MTLPNTRRHPQDGRRRHATLAALATGLILAGCGSPAQAPQPAASSSRPDHTYGWYPASPPPTYDRAKLFVSSAGNHILGTNDHVLAVGRRICRALPTTTITPLTTQIATDEHITNDHAEQAITDAINLLCTPIHRNRAEQQYLDHVAALDRSLTAHPDLTLYRGHDICYLLKHHSTEATALIARRHLYATATTAATLITTTRRTLCSQ